MIWVSNTVTRLVKRILNAVQTSGGNSGHGNVHCNEVERMIRTHLTDAADFAHTIWHWNNLDREPRWKRTSLPTTSYDCGYVDVSEVVDMR